MTRNDAQIEQAQLVRKIHKLLKSGKVTEAGLLRIKGLGRKSLDAIRSGQVPNKMREAAMEPLYFLLSLARNK